MINIFVVDPKLRKLDAMVFVANVDTKEILLNKRCRCGEIYKPEYPLYIKGGNHIIRVRLYSYIHYYKAMEFNLYREQYSDLEFCVRMEFDI